ncbi:MAG: hypothetical protein WAO58_00565 [Fimbriimonadaceae bacterium]
MPAIEALGHLMTQAWYPSNQGNIKYGGTVEQVLAQTTKNTVYIYRAVVVFFVSAFERYLEARIGADRGSTRAGGWGPYTQSLAIPALQATGTRMPRDRYPVQLNTLLEADFVREIRNRLVHTDRPVPHALADAESKRLQKNAAAWCRGAGLWNDAIESTIKLAANRVFGQAENHLKQAQRDGKNLPIELFYTLFTFSNLDRLAFEIEEALLSSTLPSNKIQRKEDHVRRKDIILAQVEMQPVG